MEKNREDAVIGEIKRVLKLEHGPGRKRGRKPKFKATAGAKADAKAQPKPTPTPKHTATKRKLSAFESQPTTRHADQQNPSSAGTTTRPTPQVARGGGGRAASASVTHQSRQHTGSVDVSSPVSKRDDVLAGAQSSDDTEEPISRLRARSKKAMRHALAKVCNLQRIKDNRAAAAAAAAAAVNAKRARHTPQQHSEPLYSSNTTPPTSAAGTITVANASAAAASVSVEAAVADMSQPQIRYVPVPVHIPVPMYLGANWRGFHPEHMYPHGYTLGNSSNNSSSSSTHNAFARPGAYAYPIGGQSLIGNLGVQGIQGIQGLRFPQHGTTPTTMMMSSSLGGLSTSWLSMTSTSTPPTIRSSAVTVPRTIGLHANVQMPGIGVAQRAVAQRAVPEYSQNCASTSLDVQAPLRHRLGQAGGNNQSSPE
jgi:hypothetical protein